MPSRCLRFSCQLGVQFVCHFQKRQAMATSSLFVSQHTSMSFTRAVTTQVRVIRMRVLRHDRMLRSTRRRMSRHRRRLRPRTLWRTTRTNCATASATKRCDSAQNANLNVLMVDENATHDGVSLHLQHWVNVQGNLQDKHAASAPSSSRLVGLYHP